MKNPLITVIIPVYNVEKYLPECLDSVLAQTYQNLEIIVVNDGSTDSSGEICEYYAKKDSRIRLIVQKNAGLSAARNAALDVAQGEYIICVDSDDYVTEDYIFYLYNLLKKSNADLSICLAQEFFNDDNKVVIERGEAENIQIYDSITALKKFLLQEGILPSAWGKLYKKELFQSVRYPIGLYYEDLGTLYKILLSCKKVVCSKQKKYYYRQHRSSIMNSSFSEKKLDRIRIAEQMRKDICSVYPEAKEWVYVRCFIANIQVLRELPIKNNCGYKTNIADNIKKYRKYTLFCSEAKKSTRFMALISYFGINVLQIAGCFYTLAFKRI